MPRKESDGTAKPSNLTHYICQDLENRIAAGDPELGDLSLKKLAEYYNVSITPIRLATNELLKKGIFIKLSNRRLQVNPEKKNVVSPQKIIDVPPPLKNWDKVLLREVVKASLSQTPQYLRENTLAKDLGIGRSIVRQILSHFSGAGLIDHIPRRGWLVHPLGVEDMHAYLVIRELLEIKALKLAMKQLEQGELEIIRERCASSVNGNLADFDNSLHEYIINKSGNRYIRQFFQQHVARYYTELFYFAAPETEEVQEMANEHLAIINSLLEKKWSKAEKLLSLHISGQETVLMKLLRKEKGKAHPSRVTYFPERI